MAEQSTTSTAPVTPAQFTRILLGFGITAVVLVGAITVASKMRRVFMLYAFEATPPLARALWSALVLLLLVCLAASLLGSHPRTAGLAYPLVFWSLLAFVLLYHAVDTLVTQPPPRSHRRIVVPPQSWSLDWQLPENGDAVLNQQERQGGK